MTRRRRVKGEDALSARRRGQVWGKRTRAVGDLMLSFEAEDGILGQLGDKVRRVRARDFPVSEGTVRLVTFFGRGSTELATVETRIVSGSTRVLAVLGSR